MKRFTIAIALTFIFIYSPGFSQTKILRAITTRSFDTSSGALESADSTTYIFNQIQQKVEASRRWTWAESASIWQLSARWLNFEYDSIGNSTFYLFQSGNDSVGWTDYYRTSRTYGTFHNVLFYLWEGWNGTSWDTISYSNNTYDSLGRTLVVMNDSYRFSYSYDSLGMLIGELSEAKGANGVWTPYSKDSVVYENNGLNSITFQFYWNSGLWKLNTRETMTSDGTGKIIQDLTEHWFGQMWRNQEIYTYSYDSAGNEIEELDRLWQDGDWRNNTRISYAFDNDANILKSFIEMFADGEWQPYYLKQYYYTENVPSHEPSGPEFQIFPNPASSLLSLTGTALKHLAIFSIDGKLIRTQALQDTKVQTIPLSLPDGQYRVQVSDAKGGVSTKILQVFH